MAAQGQPTFAASGIARLTGIISRAAEFVNLHSFSLARSASVPSNDSPGSPLRAQPKDKLPSPPTSPSRRKSQRADSAPLLHTLPPKDDGAEDNEKTAEEMMSRKLPSQVFESSLEEPLTKPAVTTGSRKGMDVPKLDRLPSQAISIASTSTGRTPYTPHHDTFMQKNDLEPDALTEAKQRMPSFSFTPGNVADEAAPTLSPIASEAGSSLFQRGSSGTDDTSGGPSSPAIFRHHRRTSSTNVSAVKETLNARSVDDPVSGERRLNQYILGRDIGKGSFGSVHEATDENTGVRYAIKEFSKARLRRKLAAERARAEAKRTGRVTRQLPRKQLSGATPEELEDALALIRAEVSVLMKLRHPNIAMLAEVLDVPSGDSLYMVLELCEGGPIVDLSQRTCDPLPPTVARSFFRQTLLALEYLHHNGVAHRDLKPDNILIFKREKHAKDEIVKLVDFGVSDAFVNATDDRTATRAGSPAFLAPELCVAQSDMVSAYAADCWSLGVTLFAMLFGRLPFIAANPLDLIDVIVKQPLQIPPEADELQRDLLERLLCKNPRQRLDINGLRLHPWVVTNDDPLPSAGENVVPIEDPTADELGMALTPLISLTGALGAYKAARQLKRLAGRRSLTADLETFHGHHQRDLILATMDGITPTQSLTDPRASLLARSGSIDDTLVPELSSVDVPVLNESPSATIKTEFSFPVPS